MMYDLVGIACTSHGSQEYIDAIREMWFDRANDAVKEFQKPRVKYQDGTPVVPWKQATEIMLQQLAVMKRVNYGG